MGRYITQSDIEQLVKSSYLVFLTNDDPDAVAVDSDVLDETISEAEAEVDSYLGVRYALPLAATPVLVAKLAARVARFRLYTRRPGEVPKDIHNDYQQARKMLRWLRDGEMSLGVDAAGDLVAATVNTGRGVRSSSRARTYGRENLEAL